jgi:hypothetical protein
MFGLLTHDDIVCRVNKAIGGRDVSIFNFYMMNVAKALLKVKFSFRQLKLTVMD